MADARLQLTGTRYSCVPYYVAVDEFDPLSRVFLDVLKSERDVGRLVRAFGLTERVVEDVLGDLIRRNKATLVIAEGRTEVRLIGEAMATPDPQPGSSLEIWQDDATRVILPASIADQFERFHGSANAEILAIQPGPGLIDEFRAAPDAQLIEMLLLSDDKLRQFNEIHTALDRLKNRYRVRPQTLWLPVIKADIFGQSIPLIAAEAEELPRWVSRVWSVALRRHSVGESGDLIAFHGAALSPKDLQDLVEGWRSTARAKAWRASVDDFLDTEPAPRVGYDLRMVREREANVTAILSTACSIKIAAPAPTAPGHDRVSWLTPILDAARDWAILLLPRPEQVSSLIDLLKRRVESDGKLPSNLIVVVPFAEQKVARAKLETLTKLAGPKRFATIMLSAWSFAPSVAVADTARVLIRYESAPRVLDLGGDSIGNEWLGIVQSLRLSTIDGDALEKTTLLRRFRVRKGGVQEDVRIGTGTEARPLYTLPQELQAFRDTLMSAIVDPQSGLLKFTPSEAPPASPPKFDPTKSLGSQMPRMRERANELSRQLELRPEAPAVFWSRLGTHDLLPTLTAVLTEPRRRAVAGDIHFLVSSVRIPEAWPSVLSLIDEAVTAHGWTVNIGLGPEEAAHGEPDLQSIRKRIASARLRLWRLPQPPAAHAIVIDDVAFVSALDWLSTLLDRPLDSASLGFAIEAAHFADALRAPFKWSEELMRR